MEPKRARTGWLDLFAQCIAIRDMNLLTFHTPYITAALLLGNGFMPKRTKEKRLLFLIAQVSLLVRKINVII